MAEGPSVTVVIPTHQRREALRTVLESLSSQSLGHAEYEVIVSVDASTDGTAEMLEDFDATAAGASGLARLTGPGRCLQRRRRGGPRRGDDRPRRRHAGRA